MASNGLDADLGDGRRPTDLVPDHEERGPLRGVIGRDEQEPLRCEVTGFTGLEVAVLERVAEVRVGRETELRQIENAVVDLVEECGRRRVAEVEHRHAANLLEPDERDRDAVDVTGRDAFRFGPGSGRLAIQVVHRVVVAVELRRQVERLELFERVTALVDEFYRAADRPPDGERAPAEGRGTEERVLRPYVLPQLARGPAPNPTSLDGPTRTVLHDRVGAGSSGGTRTR